MSFSTMAACPTDKASDLFGQGCEELGADYFDDFLNFNNDNDALDYISIPPSTYLGGSTSESNSLGTSLSLTDDETKPVIYNKDELVASPFPPTAPSQFYNDLMGRAAISDTELLSLEGINLKSPQVPEQLQRSLPPSPSPTAAASSRRKTRIAEALSKSFKRAASSFDKALLRSPIHKSVCSPKAAMGSHQIHNNDSWGQRLQQDASKFNYSFSENSRNLTPPLTCRVSDISPRQNQMPSKPSTVFANPAMLHRSAGSAAYSTPLSTPGLEQGHSRHSSGQFPSSGPLYPVTPQNQSAAASWGQLPGSPPVNNFRSSNIYSEIDEPLWWSHAATTKLAQPAPSGFHNPQRATKTLAMQLQNGLSYNTNEMAFDPTSMTSGLMIQMPGTHPHSLEMGSPPMPQLQQGFFEGGGRPQPQRRSSHQQYAQTPRRHLQQQQPPPQQPQQPQQQQQQQQQYRKFGRKARQQSSDSESSSPKSSNFHVRKRRSPKSNKQSTPRTPTLGGAVDFVNFTPQDSKKILTGVAPSGSSKTKARREKEAMDKRRRLSQAAVRAVRAAGGDIESLVEEGLFV